MDQNKRKALINYIHSSGSVHSEEFAPVVSLEQFFDGNDDLGSIGCNLVDHPGPKEFYRILRSLRDRDDVLEVLVEIHEVEEDDSTMWPFSERVFVVTHCKKATLAELLSSLQASEIETGIPVPPPLMNIPEGYTAFALWWD